MKIDAMLEWAPEERAAKRKEWTQSLFTLRLQKATGQLENPMKIRELRKDLARLATLDHMKNVPAPKHAAAPAASGTPAPASAGAVAEKPAAKKPAKPAARKAAPKKGAPKKAVAPAAKKPAAKAGKKVKK